MKAVSIISNGPEAATAAAVEHALSEAVNDVSGELTYIVQLTELLSEHANDCSPDRIDAVCLSIRHMAESIGKQLERHHDAAIAAEREASHG